MHPKLAYYQISPAVVPADQTTEVEIRCFEKQYGFEEGVLYYIDIMPLSYHERVFSDEYSVLERKRDHIEAVCKDGVVRFSYHFKGEQKWQVHVRTPESKYTKAQHKKAAEAGYGLQMYSLAPDLYARRPYKGDLHMHTNISDGIEAPETLAANYRKEGYDFICITDHHDYTAASIANSVYKDLKTNFRIYNGEEVHSYHNGQIHMINFDSAYSVNDLLLGKERPAILKEIEKIKASLPDTCHDKVDVAWYIWVYQAIKKSGGVAIFPHPYWIILGAEHASAQTVDYLFENRLFDVFEVYGGTRYAENNEQALLWHDMRAKGLSYPIVASTDAHCTREKGYECFGNAYTVAFAKSTGDVREAIEKGYAVGVQSETSKHNVTGQLRLAKYTDFLIENYFPLHDELCIGAGLMMRRYALGDRQAAKTACESTEAVIKELEDTFFGDNLSR